MVICLLIWWFRRKFIDHKSRQNKHKWEIRKRVEKWKGSKKCKEEESKEGGKEMQKKKKKREKNQVSSVFKSMRKKRLSGRGTDFSIQIGLSLGNCCWNVIPCTCGILKEQLRACFLSTCYFLTFNQQVICDAFIDHWILFIVLMAQHKLAGPLGHCHQFTCKEEKIYEPLVFIYLRKCTSENIFYNQIVLEQ